MRDYRKNKTLLTGSAAKKRKRYVFYDQMTFIIPTLENRNHEGNFPADEEENEDNPIEHENLIEPTASERPNFAKKTINKSKLSKKLLNILSKDNTVVAKAKEDELDDHKMFLLSLLPVFKKLNKAGKFSAQIEVMAVLRKHSCTNVQQPSTSFANPAQNYHRNERILPNISSNMYSPSSPWNQSQYSQPPSVQSYHSASPAGIKDTESEIYNLGTI